jgi:predicted flap endonuclease-1-like 5' DNA nuclease
MSLLDKIKSALGMEGTESESTGGNTRSTGESGVTVERETDTDTDTEPESESGAAAEEDESETDTETETDTDATAQEEEDEELETGDEEDKRKEQNEKVEESQSPEVSGTMVDTDAGVETAEVAGQANTQTGPADEPGEATGPTDTDGPGPATGQGEEIPETKTDTGDEGANPESLGAGEGEDSAEPATTESDPEEPETDGEPVDVIKGVGSAYAETLGEEGIESVDDLAAADPEMLAEETGISAKRVERWIGRAQHR